MSELEIVKRKINRADRAVVDQLSQFGVATVNKALARLGPMQQYMRPIYAGAQVSATAITVLLHPSDKLQIPRPKTPRPTALTEEAA